MIFTRNKCDADTLNLNKDKPDPYGLNREQFLPEPQIRFMEDLDELISLFFPNLLFAGKIPIFHERDEGSDIISNYIYDNIDNILLVKRSDEGIVSISAENMQLSLPSSLKYISTLQEMYFAYSSLSDEIFMSPFVKKLAIEACEFDKKELNFSELRSLKNLSIAMTNIQSIPPSIGNLKQLQRLNLNSNNELSSISDNICNLKNLQYLAIYYSPIVEIPANIGKLTELTELIINLTYINAFPASLGNLRKLKELDLCDNHFASIPNSLRIQLRQLPEMKMLNLNTKPVENPTSF